MSVALADKTEVVIKAPELRGNNFALGACQDTEVCLDGPGGCVAGETLMYNPVTGKHTPIKELYEKRIAPIVQTLMGAIQADVPFRKGVADLYRVTLASGRQCIVTSDHRFLTPDGWRFLSACAPGSQFLISSPCPYPTTEALGPLVSLQDALRLSQTPSGSQESYLVFRQDHPSLNGSNNDGSAFDFHMTRTAKTDQVRERVGFDMTFSPKGFERDNMMDVDTLMSRFPTTDLTHASISQSCGITGCFPGRPSVLPASTSPIGMVFASRLMVSEPRLTASIATKPGPISSILGHRTMHSALLTSNAGGRFGGVPFMHLPLTAPSSELTDTGIRTKRTCTTGNVREVGPTDSALDREGTFSWSCHDEIISRHHGDVNKRDNYACMARWDTVSSIEYVRTDEYFDLHVPIAEHYLAEGIWHHNTGKTFAILYKIHTLLLSYPRSKWLVCRKYNVDLAGSAMATFQESVMHPNEGVYYYGGSKVKPPGYIYPNGSFMAVSGLDRPSKLKSFECDGVYINEATEVDIDDLETARMRLRKGVIPYQQVVMDTNPDMPTHWLNQRMIEGRTTRLESRHEDNPRYWDATANDWTEEGRRYVLGILGGLTGVRLARYRYGIWAAAEGTVYEDSWDRARNVIDRVPIPKEWPRYMVVDFGYTNPFVCKWYAMDPDGRLICYREIYKTKTLVEDHAKQIKHYSRWGQDGGDPLPREIICDHDAEDRATLERHLGLYTMPAVKNVSAGIQVTASRYRPAGDGIPRLRYFRDCLMERDQELAAKKKPTSSIEEPDGYVWDTRGNQKRGEAPVKEDDHGMDCDRYLCARFDLRPTDVRYSSRIY